MPRWLLYSAPASTCAATAGAQQGKMAAAETLLVLQLLEMPQDSSLGNGNRCCGAMPMMRPQTGLIV